MEHDPRSDRALLPRVPASLALPSTPEIRLLAALLEDACFCLRPGALVSRHTRAEAIAWVRGEVRSAALCSFRELCDILGLDEHVVRDTLLARAGARVSCRPAVRASTA